MTPTPANPPSCNRFGRHVSTTIENMGFPRELLSDDEEVVVDMNPHWWTLTPIIVLLAIVVIGGLALLLNGGSGILWVIIRIIVAAVVIATLGVFLLRYAKWSTTEFVVTTERVISRTGVVAKNGIEIPLDRINTVFFEQSAFERVMRSGNLGIESAGEGGRQTFTNIRRPNVVQAEIYAQKEGFEQRRMRRMGAAASGGSAAPLSVADELTKLDDLRRRGVLSEAEFQAQKSDLLNRG